MKFHVYESKQHEETYAVVFYKGDRSVLYRYITDGIHLHNYLRLMSKDKQPLNDGDLLHADPSDFDYSYSYCYSVGFIDEILEEEYETHEVAPDDEPREVSQDAIDYVNEKLKEELKPKKDLDAEILINNKPI